MALAADVVALPACGPALLSPATAATAAAADDEYMHRGSGETSLPDNIPPNSVCISDGYITAKQAIRALPLSLHTNWLFCNFKMEECVCCHRHGLKVERKHEMAEGAQSGSCCTIYSACRESRVPASSARTSTHTHTPNILHFFTRV